MQRRVTKEDFAEQIKLNPKIAAQEAAMLSD